MSGERERPPPERRMTSEINRLLQQLTAFEQRLNTLPEPHHPVLEEAVEELATTLEELQTIDESLGMAHWAIARAHQRYQDLFDFDLFDFAPDGYVVTDPRGMIREANRAAAALFNIEPRRLVRKPLAVFVAADDRQRFLTQLGQLRRKGDLHEWEVHLQPRSTSPLPAACSVTPARDPQGQVTELRWLIRDIRERKQAEEVLRQARSVLEQAVHARTLELSRANQALHDEIGQHQQMAEERTRLLIAEQAARQELEAALAALRASEHRFRRLFASNMVGIAFWDPNGQEVEANNAFLGVVGYTREDLLAGHMRLDTLTPPEYRYLDARADEELRTRGVCTPFEKEYVCKDGRRVPVLVGMALLEDPAPQCVGFVVDLTERRRIEAQLRTTLHEKDVLFREVHHRVKNNLQIISSLLNLQADAIHDPHLLSLFQDSQHRVHAMALIHEQLYQAGDLSRVTFADYIRRLAPQVLQAYRSHVPHVTLCLEVAEVVLAIDQAIPCGLILNELITNSLKYAFPGKRPGEIHIGLHLADRSVRLTASDTGVGFPPISTFSTPPLWGYNWSARSPSSSVARSRSSAPAAPPLR